MRSHCGSAQRRFATLTLLKKELNARFANFDWLGGHNNFLFNSPTYTGLTQCAPATMLNRIETFESNDSIHEIATRSNEPVYEILVPVQELQPIHEIQLPERYNREPVLEEVHKILI